jgi:hypothetical protein
MVGISSGELAQWIAIFLVGLRDRYGSSVMEL